MSDKIIKSSILSQLLGFTFLGTFISIVDHGFNKIFIIFLFSLITLSLMFYFFEFKPIVTKYKNSSEDINLLYQPVIFFLPSQNYRIIISLICLSFYFNIFSLYIVKKFLLIYGIVCFLLFIIERFFKK